MPVITITDPVLAFLVYKLFWPLIKIATVGIITLIVSKLLQRLISKLISKFKIATELEKLLCIAARYSVYLFGATIALRIVTENVRTFNTIGIVSASILVIKTVAVVMAGLVVVSYAEKLLQRFLEKSTIDPVLFTFIRSTFRIVAYVFLAVMALDLLGVPTTTLIAGISAVGLAVSLAVKDNIANLVSGMIVIITKPFRRGDYIELSGIDGRVEEIGLVYTTLYTFDNKKILIPNNDTSKARIVNHSAETLRRLDMKFSIGYGDDYQKAKEIIMAAAKATGLMLEDEDHKIYVGMSDHGANSIDIMTRMWVDWDNFYTLRLIMLENVKVAFDREGINIPYNQLDVHIVNK